MSDSKPLRIVKLEAANVKRLTAVEITPDGNLVVIVWMERVGEGAECSVVIEDGVVRAARCDGNHAGPSCGAECWNDEAAAP